MATASQYGVTFGYGAKDGVYYGPGGKVGPYHRGNDRPCPPNTPIVIGNHTIGLTGATGIVSGPHLHTQAMFPGTNNDTNPAPFEFKYGHVVSAGWHNQFGNYITIRTNGIDLIYAHLNKINVSVGQVLGPPAPPSPPPIQQGADEMIANHDEARRMYEMLRPLGQITDGEVNATAGRRSYKEFLYTGQAEVQSRNQGLREQQAQLTNMQNTVNAQNQAIHDLTAKLQSADATGAEKQAALNNAIAKLGTTTSELETCHAKMAEAQKAVADASLQKHDAGLVKPSFLIKLLMAFIPKKK